MAGQGAINVPSHPGTPWRVVTAGIKGKSLPRADSRADRRGRLGRDPSRSTRDIAPLPRGGTKSGRRSTRRSRHMGAWVLVEDKREAQVTASTRRAHAITEVRPRRAWAGTAAAAPVGRSSIRIAQPEDPATGSGARSGTWPVPRSGRHSRAVHVEDQRQIDSPIPCRPAVVKKALNSWSRSFGSMRTPVS